MSHHTAFDSLGYAAAAFVVAASYMKEMIPLRIVAVCSNVLFLAYGIALHLVPVVVLHLTLLPLNLWRLLEATRRKRVPTAARGARNAQRGEGWLNEPGNVG